MPLKIKSATFFKVAGGLALAYVGYKFLFGEATVSEKGILDFNSVATRELRAKNPLGVSTSSHFKWDNQIGEDNSKGDHLAIFAKTQDGLNAAAKLLFKSSAYFGHGDNDIISIGNSWAGDDHYTNPLNDDEHDVSDYAYNLWRVLKGYGGQYSDPFASLHLATDGIPVMRSLSRMENGTIQVAGIPDEMFRTAIAYGINS